MVIMKLFLEQKIIDAKVNKLEVVEILFLSSEI